MFSIFRVLQVLVLYIYRVSEKKTVKVVLRPVIIQINIKSYRIINLMKKKIVFYYYEIKKLQACQFS